MGEVTAGSIKALYDNKKNSPLTKHPRVQIINIKSVETNGKTRYRALVSDGIHFMQAMLATQYAPIVEQGKIKRNSIVRLRETVCNELQFRKILIILELDVVATDVDLRVGSPVGLENNINPGSPVPSTTNGRSMSVASSSSLPSTLSNPSQYQYQYQQYQQQSRSQSYTASSFSNPIQYHNEQLKHEQQFQIKQENRQYQQQQEERQYQQQQQENRQYQQQQQQQQQQLRSQAHISSQAYTSNQSFSQSTQLFSQSSQPLSQSAQPLSQYTQFTYDSQPNYPNKLRSSPISSTHSLTSLSKSSFPPSTSYSLMSSSKSGPRSSMFSSQESASSVLSSSQMPSSQQSISRMETPILQIKDLTPYLRNWAIKVRVSMKTSVRTWNNVRSSGRLFSVNFVDQSGEIGATGFNDQVTRFYELLQDESVYMITKAKITMNNKRFSNLSNDYELHLESGTDIKLCVDDGTIPFMKIDQVRLSDLDKYPLHSIVDIMGIVVEDKGMFEVIKRTKGAGKLVHKREIMVVDMSLKKVKFTLWDDEARDFDTKGSPVIVCKGARVGQYEGTYLSTSPSTAIKRNPKHPDAKKLKDWYESIGFRLDYTTFQPVGTEEISDKLPKISIVTSIAENFGHIDKPDYFVCRATITYIKPDNSIYAGCPDCKKKTSINNGQWWCERCEKSYEEPVWKYILTVSINDNTGQFFVNMFDETTTRILGLNAQQFLKLKETDEEAAENIITKMLFKTYNFKIRARQELFNDIYRIKYQVVEMNEINYVKESRALVQDIYNLL